jgi:bifunctional non-homologous end joining protein LigD
MAARIDRGRVQLLTRTGLDWIDKYPSVVSALANLKAKTTCIDGELCGVDDAGLPSFAQIQAATDGERSVRLVYYAFDLLHLDGQDVSGLPLIERKALLKPLVADRPGPQFNGHETGDGELILRHAGKLGFEGVVSKTRCAIRAGKPGPLAQGQMAEPPRVRHRRLVKPRKERDLTSGRCR